MDAAPNQPAAGADPPAAGPPQDTPDDQGQGVIDPDVPQEPRVSGDPNPDDPPAGGDTGVNACVARNATDTNTVAPQPDGPIILVPVRILLQYDTRWAYNNLRPPDKQNGCYSPLEQKERGEGDPNSWKDNGCYPVSFTMVIRWWCEDYPVTKGQIVLPTNFSAYPATLDPLSMCKIFNGTPYFPCFAGSPLAPRCPTVLASNSQPGNGPPGPTTGNPPKCNTLFSKSQPAADGTQLCAGNCQTDLSKQDPTACTGPGHGTYCVGEVAPYARKLSFQGNNMTYERWKCLGETGANKAAKLKSWLGCGPVMVNMTKPGHWVVVTGYRNQLIHVNDPGLIIRGKPYWKGGVPGDGDPNGNGIVFVTEDWLACVTAMDLITFHPFVDEGENAAWYA